MAVKVVTSYWNHETKKDEETVNVYPSADNWDIVTRGTAPNERFYLEVSERANDRVVALFESFDRVEAVDDEDED